jgi:TRAP-type C4-dicarboxylate transport system substrate-binding protein
MPFVFSSVKQGIAAMNGALGAYLRRELATKGIYMFTPMMDTGMRQMATTTKPIRTVDDLQGLKIRAAQTPNVVDFFKTLGASPTPLAVAEVYTALQTHLVDGSDSSMATIEGSKQYEVLKFISNTNHVWNQHSVSVNTEKWNSLPSDIQGVIERNLAKYAKLELGDEQAVEAALADKLRRRGLVIVERPDVASMRARLTPYYARWKNYYGSTAWSLLESSVGLKLG